MSPHASAASQSGPHFATWGAHFAALQSVHATLDRALMPDAPAPPELEFVAHEPVPPEEHPAANRPRTRSDRNMRRTLPRAARHGFGSHVHAHTVSDEFGRRPQ